MSNSERVAYSVLKRFATLFRVETSEDISALLPRGVAFQEYKGSYCLGLCFSVLTNNEVYGVAVPWWERIESATLVAPVIRKDYQGVKAGLVVLGHWLDSFSLATATRLLCGHYVKSCKMDHSVEVSSRDFLKDSAIHYHLRSDYRWNVFKVLPQSGLSELATDSFENFLLMRHHLYSFGGGSAFFPEVSSQTYESSLEISCYPKDSPVWKVSEQSIRADLDFFFQPFEAMKQPELSACSIFAELRIKVGKRRRLLETSAVEDIEIDPSTVEVA